MAPIPNLPAILQDTIANDTFPAEEFVLTSEFPSATTASFIDAITRSRHDLEEEIRQVSRGQAGDVDGWISQAKQLQEDIARCKSEARQIVQEHKRVEDLKAVAREASAKVSFLENEITFTQALESELKIIAEVSQELKEIENTLTSRNAVEGARRLARVQQRINTISTTEIRKLLSESLRNSTEDARKQLEAALDSTIVYHRDDSSISLAIHSDSMPDLLGGCSHLNLQSAASARIAKHIETSILQPDVLGRSSRISNAETKGVEVVVSLADQAVPAVNVLRAANVVTQYIHDGLPEMIRSEVEETICSSIVETLINECLIPAIPYEVSDLSNLEEVSEQTLLLAQELRDLAGNESQVLRRWVDQVPQLWLSKRRIGTLDAVRHIFKKASLQRRQVERVEKAIIKNDVLVENAAENEDWNAGWDDDEANQEPKKERAEDEDASGWGFEEDDSSKDANANGNHNTDDEAGDAWGWDDDKAEEQSTPVSKESTARVRDFAKTNGADQSRIPEETEMVITETYSITDVPDYLLEIIGKDISDAQDLQTSPSGVLSKPSISSGLLSLCTLSLAMFRAIAVTTYTTTPLLSNMHLYNDSLYIISKLESIQPSSALPNLTSDSAMLLKLARTSYSREMETQRTILSDLLDGAQGFTSSTKPTFSTEITTAVASVVDRIRSVHETWKNLLAESALLQSTGALVTTIIEKVMKDILDMDDISELESHQLSTHCKTIISLRDLFISVPPTPGIPNTTIPPPEQQEEPRDTAALYVPNWIRFEYLVEMLGSSLADIRWMWEDGELGLFWQNEEVVELMKALFAESRYRREAIGTVRQPRMPRTR